MKQQTLEKQVADLEEQNAKLRAEIDNLQAPRPAPTIVDIIGIEAFDRMVDLYPSFSEDGDPTLQIDPASAVLWSCVRMLSRTEENLDGVLKRKSQIISAYNAIDVQLERATNALAELAMRTAEEATQ
jgi:hypothetical protein